MKDSQKNKQHPQFKPTTHPKLLVKTNTKAGFIPLVDNAWQETQDFGESLYSNVKGWLGFK